MGAAKTMTESRLASISSCSSLAPQGPFFRTHTWHAAKAHTLAMYTQGSRFQSNQKPSRSPGIEGREGGACHKMPRSFTVKPTRKRRRRKRKNTTQEIASGPGENKSSQRLQGCRLLLTTATKLMRFLAPPFLSQTHSTRTHTLHWQGGQGERRGGSPSRSPLVHRLGDEVEKALGILLGVHR